jgi:sarcosine oxidase, subunit beta
MTLSADMAYPTYDAVVIGSGSVGAPIARELAEAGLKTLVLDKCASAGQGSNKRAIGGIRATHSDPSKIQICLKSIEIFSQWEDTYGDDIAWEQGGYSFVAYREREEKILKDLLASQKQYGLGIDWYDRQELLKIIPTLNSYELRGGTFSPGDGSASPMLSILAFERRAREKGADFHYDEEVVGFIRQNGRIIGVKTNRDTYHSSVVINAAGSDARQVASYAGIDVPVFPDSHEAGITEPVAHFLRPMLVDIRPLEGSSNYYFYQHQTGQIIFCITPNPPIVGSDCRETSVFLPMVARRMLDVMPCLRNIKVRRTWRGLYPNTPDGSPIVGEVHGLEGYLNAVGMCGQGYMLGPGLAYYLRLFITQENASEARLVLNPLSLHRDFGIKETLK